MPTAGVFSLPGDWWALKNVRMATAVGSSTSIRDLVAHGFDELRRGFKGRCVNGLPERKIVIGIEVMTWVFGAYSDSSTSRQNSMRSS